jgi:DNA-binding NtrC family response regulator
MRQADSQEKDMNDKITILFVDDDDKILSAIHRELMDEPYEFLLATSGQEALKILEQNEVAVLVSDMRMPQMDGMELLKIAKEKHPATIRMMISGHANITSLLKAINENIIYKFITKPWKDSEELKSIVKQAVNYYNLRRERDLLLAQVQQYREQAAK